MIITGKVFCLFEQSGVFKNEFLKLGISAEDYDIQNKYDETDHVIDLFKEIDDAYEGKPSLFDEINPDDLIMAFFPCIYFCATSQMAFYMSYVNYQRLNDEQKINKILERSSKREEFYTRLIKFCAVCLRKGIRMIFENPWSEQTYLKTNFIKVPDVVDMDRTKRGDLFKKPTAYWFWNCNPTIGYSYQTPVERKTILNTNKQGVERSLITSDYARNFICDFILGQEQPNICEFELT